MLFAWPLKCSILEVSCHGVHCSLSLLLLLQRVDLTQGLTVASQLEGDDGVLHVEDAWAGVFLGYLECNPALKAMMRLDSKHSFW